MLYQLKKLDFVHEDNRGVLKQLVHGGYRQINVIMSKKGVSRGGHYHKQNTEAFYIISGAGEVNLIRDGETDIFHFTTGSFFEIPAYVAHSFHFLEDTILVSMYSLGVEKGDGSKDIYSF